MVAFKFSAVNIEPGRAFEPVPSGNYPVIITHSEMKTTQRGDGRYLQLEMTIQDGPHRGQKVFDRLNVENPSEQAMAIAQRALSAICHVTQVLHFEDSQQLHARPFVAVVSKQERNDKPGEFMNTVKGYKNADGSDPVYGGQVAQPASQPEWAARSQPQAPIPFPSQASNGPQQVQPHPIVQQAAQQTPAPLSPIAPVPPQQATQAAPPWVQR